MPEEARMTRSLSSGPALAVLVLVTTCYTLLVGHALAADTMLSALALASLPVVAIVIASPGTAFLIAIGIALILPHYVGYAWLLPPLLVGASILPRKLHVRLNRIDVAFILWLAWTFVSWLLHPELGVTKTVLLADTVPLLFYVWARVSLTPRALKPVLWTLLGAGTIGAFSVIVEWIYGRVIFSDPTNYQWARADQLFRPGGVFGGSPAAGISLALILLSTLVLVRDRKRLVLACLTVIVFAILVADGRAGWIGLLAGLFAYALLARRVKPGRIAYGIAIGAIAVYMFLPAITQSSVYERGVVRPGSYTGRATFLDLALPLTTDTRSHFLFGRGFEAFKSPGIHDPNLQAVPILLQRGGPHNELVREVLEQGIVGLALFLLWIVGSIAICGRAALRFPRNSDQQLAAAGLTATLVAFLASGLFHDVAHNVPIMSVAVLTAGVLSTVTAWSTADWEGAMARRPIVSRLFERRAETAELARRPLHLWARAE